MIVTVVVLELRTRLLGCTNNLDPSESCVLFLNPIFFNEPEAKTLDLSRFHSPLPPSLFRTDILPLVPFPPLRALWHYLELFWHQIPKGQAPKQSQGEGEGGGGGGPWFFPPPPLFKLPSKIRGGGGGEEVEDGVENFSNSTSEAKTVFLSPFPGAGFDRKKGGIVRTLVLNSTFHRKTFLNHTKFWGMRNKTFIMF